MNACASIESPSKNEGYDSANITNLLSKLDGVDVIILGETHGNPYHHEIQTRLVKALEPPALVFEMVPEAKEVVVNDIRKKGGAQGGLRAALEWDKSSWPDWSLYAPIFEAAPKAYVAGGGVSKPDIRGAMTKGADALFYNSAEYGLDTPLPAHIQSGMISDLIESHCNAIPESVAVKMVEAQRLRDANFSKAVMRAKTEAGTPIVVITGSGHARIDRGMPIYLKHFSPKLGVTSIGMLENGSANTVDAANFDYVIVTSAVRRNDPCEGFNLK